jgi:hypothetical protein
LLPVSSLGGAEPVCRLLNEMEYGGAVRLCGKVARDVAYEARDQLRTSCSEDFDFATDQTVIASSAALSRGTIAEEAYHVLLQRATHGLAGAVVLTGGMPPSGSDNYHLLQSARQGCLQVYEIPLVAHASYWELWEVICRLQPRFVVEVHGPGLKKEKW